MAVSYELSEKSAWHTIIANWPDSAIHHLIDMMPQFRPFPWEQFCPLQDISRDRWYSALSLRDLGCKGDIVIWQEEKLTYEQCMKFRENISVVVGCVFNDHVCKIEVDLTNFDSYQILFHSSDRIKLKVFTSKKSISKVIEAPPMEKYESLMPIIPEKIVKRIFVKMTHPLLSSINFFQGKGVIVWETETELVKWQFTTETDNVPITGVPDIVKVNWIEHVRKPVLNENYISPVYYEANMMDYSAWSLPTHRIQMREILSHLKGDEMLVVPGDGLGLVDSLWAGKIIAGDLNAFGGRVHKESFISTLVRARKQTQKGVLVLSYVTGLMSSSEILVMEQWKGPVIWVDSHNICPILGCTLVSYGIAFRGLDPPKKILTGEQMQSAPKRQLYSENLLRLESISYILPKNASVLYWEMMRPFGKSEQWVPGCQSCLVADNLNDCVDYLDKRVSCPSFFLNSTGMMGRLPLAYLFEEDNVFSGRTVYAASLSHPYTAEIMKHTHWALRRDRLYFVFPDRPWTHSFPNGIGTTRFSVVSYTKPVEQKESVKIVSFWNDTIIVNTLSGTLVWKCWSPLIKSAMREYFTQFAPTGWQKTFDALTPLSKNDTTMGNSSKTISRRLNKYYEFLGNTYLQFKTLRPDPFVLPFFWRNLTDQHVEDLIRLDPECKKDKELRLVWEKQYKKDSVLSGLFATGFIEYT